MEGCFYLHNRYKNGKIGIEKRQVTVLDGVGEFTVGGVKHVCKAGEALVMPATIPHAVYAVERFKMLLTVVFPIEK